MVRTYSTLVRHPDNMPLFKSIEMSVLAAQNGAPLHIHAEGLRGTGKTTILRSAKEVLPRIERIKGCLYNCDPKNPHCPEHRNLDYSTLCQIGTEWIPMPFLEISHSAKLATVVGGIDLNKLTSATQPEAALLPGTLAQAHRGIVFIDEVNRLADTSPELADVLLDIMGTKPGRLQIEDAGLPKVELTSLVTVWAASNPDEDPGPLEGIRRQLADRFDLCVGVRRPGSISTIMAILKQNEPLSELGSEEAHIAVSARLNSALHRLTELSISERVLTFLARVYLDHGLESLRALEAIIQAAKVHASLQGKNEVGADDLRLVIPLALKHRTSPHVLSDILESLERWAKATTEEQASPVPQEARIKEEETEVAQQDMSLQGNKNFLSRLLGSLRDPKHQDEKTGDSQFPMYPTSGVTPVGLRESGEGVLDSSLVDPETVSIIAPPNLAKSINEVVESRLIMSEEALRRDK